MISSGIRVRNRPLSTRSATDTMSVTSSEHSLTGNAAGPSQSAPTARLPSGGLLWMRNQARPSQIFLLLVALRIVNALSLRTFFQPDEFFQSLEPAWQSVFGQESGAWITWEWKHHLRSSIHPLIFAAVYYIAQCIASTLRLSQFSAANLLIAAPKTAQAVIAATGDYFTWRLASRIYGRYSSEAWAALVLTVLSPWQWFCSTRTFSNCLETALTAVALDLWPWDWLSNIRHPDQGTQDGDSQATDGGPTTVDHPTRHQSQPKNISSLKFPTAAVSSLRTCLVLAAIACVLRPTNVLIWLCLGAFAIWRAPWSTRAVLVREALACGVVVLGTSLAVDRLYYRTWTFPPFKFLYFNIAQSLSVFYGRNDWHYYISQGLPLLLTMALPFAIVGLYRAVRGVDDLISRRRALIKRQLAVVCLFVPFVMSLIAHKEVRFIYPLLPALHVLAAEPVGTFFLPAVSSSSNVYLPRRLILLFLVFVNISIAFYTSLVHASGSLAVLSYLRERHQAHQGLAPSGTDNNMTVGFLMPCHSTPWRSHLVFPSINAWALSCEPPIDMDEAQKATYLDEADQFYANPVEFLQNNMVGGLRHVPRRPSYLERSVSPPYGVTEGSSQHPWPDYLIFFSQLEPTLRKALRGSFYNECWRTFNTAWHDDWRRRGDIIVWCLDPLEQQSWYRIQHRKHLDAQNERFNRIISKMTLEGGGRKQGRSIWDCLRSLCLGSSRRPVPWFSYDAIGRRWPFARSRSSLLSRPSLPQWLSDSIPGTSRPKYPFLPSFFQPPRPSSIRWPFSSSSKRSRWPPFSWWASEAYHQAVSNDEDRSLWD